MTAIQLGFAQNVRQRIMEGGQLGILGLFTQMNVDGVRKRSPFALLEIMGIPPMNKMHKLMIKEYIDAVKRFEKALDDQNQKLEKRIPVDRKTLSDAMQELDKHTAILLSNDLMTKLYR